MEETKERIIAAAEELISQNGLSETTISGIARKAGFADSLVYQYFKGKEDLLFSIAYRNLKTVMILAEEQLQGIPDPVSRLSKIIWYSLNYNRRNPDYATIMMFECHSKKSFYETPAYRLHQQYFQIIYEILMQGVAEGVFRRDVDMNLVKEMITGVIGAEIVEMLTHPGGSEGSDDLRDIMSLILPMIAVTDEKEIRDKRIRILRAAEEVFSNRGFSKAKISDIAKAAKVAEGTIYEYFENKEDLLLSIPIDRFEKHLKPLSEAFMADKPLDKLVRFFKNHFDLFLSDPEFLRVFLTHIVLNPKFYSAPSYRIYSRYISELDNIIEEGKKDGGFRKTVNTRIFRNLFLGSFNYMVIRWLSIDKEKTYDKLMEIHNLVELLTRSVTEATTLERP